MKIGIYGGTFNPIHLGHMEAARFAVEYLELDQLLLVPAGIPPHKTMDAETPGPDCRLAMTDLAAQAVSPAAVRGGRATPWTPSGLCGRSTPRPDSIC